MRTNAGQGVPNATLREVGLVEQMALLDSLPAELRECVYEAPLPVDIRDIAEMGRQYGGRARELIEWAYDQDFPGWRVTVRQRGRHLR